MNTIAKFLNNVELPLAVLRVPIIDVVKDYSYHTLWDDFVAGITIFVFLVPQGMAFALLAGLKPEYGLFSSIFPLFIYAFFGTSRQMSIGPMAITSLLLNVSCQGYGYEESTPEFTQLALSVTFLVGMCSVYLGLFRLGILANIISPGVLSGFITASSFVIMINQVKYVVGFEVPRFSYIHQTIYYILSHIQHTNVYEFLMGLGTIITLLTVRELKRRNKTPPKDEKWLYIYKGLFVFSNLINFFVIFFATLIAKSLIENGIDITIVGDVPSGFKPVQFNLVPFGTLVKLFPSSLAIAFVHFAGNWAVAVKYANKEKYDVDANQELLATGFALSIGMMFNSFAVSGGLGRSAVNAESGAKTQLAGCISATFILISLLSVTSFFYYIPMCVLGAVIGVSVISMIDFEAVKEAYRIDKRDCFVMVVTILATFFIGVSQGLFVGIFLSIAVVLRTSAFPRIVHLGKFPEALGGHFRDATKFKEAKQIPGYAIIRMDASLFYANATFFKETVLNAVNGHYHTDSDVPIHSVIIDTSAWIDIDVVGIKTLYEIKNELKSVYNVTLFVVGAKVTLRERLGPAGFIDDIGLDHFNMSIDDALDSKPGVASTRGKALSNVSDAKYVELEDQSNDETDNPMITHLPKLSSSNTYTSIATSDQTSDFYPQI